jgi:hypothetical protein
MHAVGSTGTQAAHRHLTVPALPQCDHCCLYICCQANLQQAALLASSHTDLPATMVKELATRSETVTPWWWGLKTLIKVGMDRDRRHAQSFVSHCRNGAVT